MQILEIASLFVFKMLLFKGVYYNLYALYVAYCLDSESKTNLSM